MRTVGYLFLFISGDAFSKADMQTFRGTCEDGQEATFVLENTTLEGREKFKAVSKGLEADCKTKDSLLKEVKFPMD